MPFASRAAPIGASGPTGTGRAGGAVTAGSTCGLISRRLRPGGPEVLRRRIPLRLTGSAPARAVAATAGPCAADSCATAREPP